MPTSSERAQHLMDNEEQFQTFLGLIRTGQPFGLACKACRITRLAMNTYLDRNPARAAMYVDAELEATEKVEQVLYEEALGRQKWAVQLWLERRAADRWAPAAQDGPKRIVLDPAALKGMIGVGSDPADASVVEDDGEVVAEPEPQVAGLDIKEPEPGVLLDSVPDTVELPGRGEQVGDLTDPLLNQPPWAVG